VSNVGLVIFDCDGVLVDSERISCRVLAQALTAVGLDTTPEDARREYLGPRLAEVLARAESRLGRVLGPGWLRQFEQDRADAFRRELLPVPGAAEVVARLVHSGFAVCVASQGKLEKTRLTLALTGLSSLFPRTALFSAEEVPRGKPEPDLFLHAANVMGTPPARCVVAEDSPIGVAAAAAAGMHPLGFAANTDPGTLREAGAETFMTLSELPRLIEGL
jgi:HAD superfamily hydrolase (TIGR01509 family)